MNGKLYLNSLLSLDSWGSYYLHCLSVPLPLSSASSTWWEYCILIYNLQSAWSSARSLRYGKDLVIIELFTQSWFVEDKLLQSVTSLSPVTHDGLQLFCVWSSIHPSSFYCLSEWEIQLLLWYDYTRDPSHWSYQRRWPSSSGPSPVALHLVGTRSVVSLISAAKIRLCSDVCIPRQIVICLHSIFLSLTHWQTSAVYSHLYVLPPTASPSVWQIFLWKTGLRCLLENLTGSLQE